MIMVLEDLRHSNNQRHQSCDKFKSLIDAAQAGPIALLKVGKSCAIVVSSSEYERLSIADWIRQEAKVRLKQTIAAMQTEATASGWTEAELERLLAGES